MIIIYMLITIIEDSITFEKLSYIYIRQTESIQVGTYF